MVSSDLRKFLRTAFAVSTGHVVQLPAFIASIHVSSTEKPAAAWRYLIVCPIDGMSYTLATSSLSVHDAVTVHSFSPFFLHPWRTGGSLIVIVSVPFLCIVTPLLPGLNIVVYPCSAILFTFNSDFANPGSMWASLASADSCSKGSCVLLVAFSVESSGK